MSIKSSHYEQLLCEYSDRLSAISLLKQHRSYLEMIPSLRRPEESLITIPLPVVKVRQPKPLNESRLTSPNIQEAIQLPCDLSTIAWIPEDSRSWALPLRHERITSFETPISKATWQLKQVRRSVNYPILALLDSEYGNASWVNQTVDVEVDCLIRIRSNCCLYGAPGQYSGRGRPRKHGDKFKLNDKLTWWDATEIVELNDDKLGKIKVRKWSQLHFLKSSSVNMTLILVERLETNKKGSLQKPLWLVFIGKQKLDILPLELLWKKYLRRFTVDHWYRFIKQRLHWTLPALSTPHQCERWSDLMPLITWQLWLAKDLVEEKYLPWQKPQKNLSPGRVAQSMFGLLVEIGTPARTPKPRGKSPGWESGQVRTKRTRYPVIKKRKSPDKKAKKKKT